MRDVGSDRDRFAQAVFASSLGYFDILSIHLGLRLGLYRALTDGGAMTSDELAGEAGCGTGWSSIAIARAYPSAQIDGFDPDEISIQMARDHADEAGISDRVRFHREDAAELTRHGPFDVATAFECIHDMARPVEVLRAVKGAIVDDGAMLIVGERTKDGSSGDPDDREA